MTTKVTPTKSRLAFLDWTRGLAAVVMLQGHVFHSFARADLRDGAPYVFSQFLGGLPPAIFLFLTGVTFGFLMDGREQQEARPWERVLAALYRARYLFLIAIAFRLQLWAFSWPVSPWTDLFKVDILNCMALAMAVMSVMAIFQTAERVRLCAVLGLAIAAASPIVSQLDWGGVHSIVKNYLAPDYLSFSFFPWAAFLAFGLSAGSVMRLIEPRHIGRMMQWSALGGFGLIFGGQYFSNLPYSLYARSEFWLDSPALIAMKLGVTLLIVAFAYLWTHFAVPRSWSWVQQLGTTSLLVYWVHIELVYGRWLGSWKESLGVAQTTALSVGVILLMLAISVARSRWTSWRGLFGVFSRSLSVPRQAD